MQALSPSKMSEQQSSHVANMPVPGLQNPSFFECNASAIVSGKVITCRHQTMLISNQAYPYMRTIVQFTKSIVTILTAVSITLLLQSGTLHRVRSIGLRSVLEGLITGLIIPALLWSSFTSFGRLIRREQKLTDTERFPGQNPSKIKLFLSLLLCVMLAQGTTAATRYARATGNWNSTSTWASSSTGSTGASVPSASDNVIIDQGITVTVTSNATCASITFTSNSASTITVNSGITLTVTGAITIPRASSNINTLAVGAGTVTAGSLSFTSGGTTSRHQVSISTGTMTVTGNISGSTGNVSGTIVFTGAGTLNVGGSIFNAADGTLTTATGSIVKYNASAAQTIGNFTYDNLTLSGSAAKTIASGQTITVDEILSMEGTATLTKTGTLTYGAAATLQYNTSTARTASSAEWITPFTATGGVIITNTGTITLNETKAFTSSPLRVNTGSTLALGAFNLSGASSVTVECGGTTTGGSITGTGILTPAGDISIVDAAKGTGAATISSPVSLTANRVINVNSDGTTATDLTLSGAVSGNFQLTVDGIGEATISGIRSGTGALVKNGTGTLTLSGTNTYTGATTINAGTINVATIGNGGVAGNLGQATNAAANLVFGGGTLNYTGATASSDRAFTINAGSTASIDVPASVTLTMTGSVPSTTGALTKAGAGTLQLSGTNLFTGAITVSSGTLRLGNADAFPNNSAVAVSGTFDMNGFSKTIGQLTGAGSVTSNVAGAVTLTIGNDHSNSTFSGIISNGSGTLSITKIGTGDLALSGNNTFTGVVSIDAGTLSVATIGNGGTASPLGQATSAASNLLLNGGTLRYTGATASSSRSFTLSNATSSAIEVNLAVTTLTLSGSSATTTGALSKTGDGTLILSGAHAYTGSTTVSVGTLKLGAADRISNSSALIVLSGASFDLNGFNETVGSITGAGTITSDASATTQTLTVGSDNSSTIWSGTIANGASSFNGLTKIGTGTLTITGNGTYRGLLTINEGTVKLGSNGTMSATPVGSTHNGTIVNSGGVLDLNGFSLATSESLTLNGSGTLINSGSNATFQGTVSTSSNSSIIASASGSITLSGAVSNNYVLTLDGNGSGIISGIISGTGSLSKVGAGSWSLNASNTFSGGTSLNAGTLNINNAQALGSALFTINGGSINAAVSAITLTNNNPLKLNGNFGFTGTNNLNLGAGDVTQEKNLDINVSAATLTIGGVNRNTYNLIKSGPGNLSLGSNDFALNDLTIQQGSFISTSGTLKISGTITNNGTFVHNNGIVEYNGSASQTVNALNYYNVKINNALGVQLGGNVTVMNRIDLTNGHLVLSEYNLTVASAINGSRNSYIKTNGNGKMKATIPNSSAVTFQVGNGSYNPVTITNRTGAADEFAVRVTDQLFANGYGVNPVTSPRVNRTWHIDKTNPNGGAGIDFVFNWNVSDNIGAVSPKLNHHNGTKWEILTGTTVVTSTSLSYTGYLGGFSPFSVFENTALPLNWKKFEGIKSGSNVVLNWETTNEQNTRDFLIQRSETGLNWSTLGTVMASGNSTIVRSYQYVDKHPLKANYYRLVQRDFDEKSTLSKIISVMFSDALSSVSIYPNPVTNGHITIVLPTESVVSIYSTSGHLVLSKNLQQGTHALDLGSVPKGVYHVIAGEFNGKIIVQ